MWNVFLTSNMYYYYYSKEVMEWHKVIIMEPLDIIIKESAKPSYTDNQLSYYFTLDKCTNKKQ